MDGSGKAGDGEQKRLHEHVNGEVTEFEKLQKVIVQRDCTVSILTFLVDCVCVSH